MYVISMEELRRSPLLSRHAGAGRGQFVPSFRHSDAI